MWEHRIIERMITVLEEEISRMKKTGKADPRFIVSAVDFFRTYADRTHHGKEEDILFKLLESKMLDEAHTATMEELREEHEYARATVGRLLEGHSRGIGSQRRLVSATRATVEILECGASDAG